MSTATFTAQQHGLRILGLEVAVLLLAALATSASLTPVQSQTSERVDCAALAEEGVALREEDDRHGLRTLIETSSLPCPEESLDLRHKLAALLWNTAIDLHESGRPEREQVAALMAVVEVLPLWQAHAALGDILAAERNHEAAIDHYQRAIDSINSSELTPKAPPEAVIAQVFRKAQDSRLLARTYVATSRSTRGEPGGLAARSVRSFGVERVALPIEFEFDSTEFTSKGRAASEDLLEFLTKQDTQKIALIGHTDPVGDPDYNLQLSVRRAATVAEFLRQRGYRGEVESVGLGQTEPYQPADPEGLTQEELYQMHRRVELKRK